MIPQKAAGIKQKGGSFAANGPHRLEVLWRQKEWPKYCISATWAWGFRTYHAKPKTAINEVNSRFSISQTSHGDGGVCFTGTSF